MSDSNAPDHEFLCASCGYNLRGLNANEVCPECACSVGISLVRVIGLEGNLEDAEKLLAAANEANVSLVGAMLVMQAVNHAHLVRLAASYSERAMHRVSGAGAEEICQAVVDLVEEIGKGPRDSKLILQGIGLHTSAHVGRVVRLLAAADLLDVSLTGEFSHKFEHLEIIERWLSN